MKKFKDFIYDKNDIFIALLILVAAALLISWRMDAIMEYPKTLISDTDDTSTEISGSEDQPAENGGSSGSESTESNSSGSEEQSGETEETDSPLWSDGVLSRSVTVTVKGDSAAEAVQCLVNAGLFEDYEDYQSACEKAGLDHQKISAGNFKFAKGSSRSDVAKEVNWG